MLVLGPNHAGKLSLCKAFHFAYRKAVRGNHYGRQEEVYICEDCSGCPYAEQCKKTAKNRTIRLNSELNMKNDRWYKRIVRRGIESGRMEIYLVSIGHNLYKYHNKQMRLQKAA